MTTSALQQQRKYVEELKRKKFNFGLTVGDAFVRGIRDIGYKHTGTALDEQIDNGYQAGADQIHVIFGYGGSTSQKKPTEIAVLDNGHGMEPEMVRAAVTWGGTHREGDRTGFGRYGYGLPSSAISQGTKYTVFSKTSDGELNAVTIDVEDISEGRNTNKDGLIVVPEARKAKLPAFVSKYIDEQLGGDWDHGTIVVMEKLDRIERTTTSGLHKFLMEHFGVTYHKLRGDFDIVVNGELVQPIDPLFITPGYRYYDLDEQRAEALEPIVIDVKDPKTKAVKGKITVRMSYMRPDFASLDKMKKATANNANDRFSILRKFNGFIFSRNGRIIDVVTRNPLTSFQTNDRYIKVEIDFPAELDEHFNISTSKQRVDVSEQIWDRLREAGLSKAIDHLRAKFKEKNAELKNIREQDKNKKRASEEAMERAAELADPRPNKDDAERREKRGEEGLEREAARRSSETGVDPDTTRRQLELEIKDRGYKVAFDNSAGAPIFRVEQIGGAKALFINKASRFFQEVHSGPKSTPDVRAALELLLFSIGDRILDTKDTQRDWYQFEIGEWSRKLELSLGQLQLQVTSNEEENDEEDTKAAA
ncbi:MAG: ATP-binding protein [Erythrobacter sp.]|uniref:ATP-binding protein n=1 Tax=Erythrobacter sp. TaxID=1042 RepID=UPI00262B7D15|nr:ATP-binding protein [Erythrobacter sp.]MDJ0977660.1 ATP-binding protein [Erythrobacter sp.]